jgi:hypothetical protein
MFVGKKPLPKGKVQLKVGFAYDGKVGEVSKSATVTMGERHQGRRRPTAETIPIQISADEGFNVGMDSGSTVDFTCKPPFPFTGTIE